MITGGRATRKWSEQGCFLFACRFMSLFFYFASVNTKTGVKLVFTGKSGFFRGFKDRSVNISEVVYNLYCGPDG